jgi:capsular polysaccharide biosynthesis protein
VAEAVVERLDLDLTPEQLLQNLSVEQISTTQFIQVSYRDPDPEEARRVVNAVGEVFSEQVSEAPDTAT